MKAWHQKRTLAKVMGDKAAHEPQRWEEDYQLVECEGLFEEYLEMGMYYLLYLKDMMSLHAITYSINMFLIVLQYSNLDSSPSSWQRSPSLHSSHSSTTGWKSVWMPTSLHASTGVRWQSAPRTLESGSTYWKPCHTCPSSPM